MHAISSYRGNSPMHTHTHTNTHTIPQTGPITIHCAAASLARSVTTSEWLKHATATVKHDYIGQDRPKFAHNWLTPSFMQPCASFLATPHAIPLPLPWSTVFTRTHRTYVSRHEITDMLLTTSPPTRTKAGASSCCCDL